MPTPVHPALLRLCPRLRWLDQLARMDALARATRDPRHVRAAQVHRAGVEKLARR